MAEKPFARTLALRACAWMPTVRLGGPVACRANAPRADTRSLGWLLRRRAQISRGSSPAAGGAGQRRRILQRPLPDRRRAPRSGERGGLGEQRQSIRRGNRGKPEGEE